MKSIGSRRSHFRGARRGCAPAVLLALTVTVHVALATDQVTWSDDRGDAVARRTDPGASTPFDPEAHRLIDCYEIRLGSWSPYAPPTDLFAGEFSSYGQFLRVDITVGGLVNPPGKVSGPFDPFRYGANPVYGFVEFDVDLDVSTGGELDNPHLRYLGNAVRFGGKPAREEFMDRVALDGTAFDNDILTPPFVDRSGEEFHLALLGDEFTTAGITEIVGNGDNVFGEGETWVLKGSFFHRAHGFEDFSFVPGGGRYAPACDFQFKHDPALDVTLLSLVFPLTNEGAASVSGDPPELLNGDPSDQASVLEALDDLQFSADYYTMLLGGDPRADIIIGWADHTPSEYLDPRDWSITAELGTSYTQENPTGLYFVWTDVFPDVERGDVDGDTERDVDDLDLVAQYIADKDGSDGVSDGRVVLAGFASNFSVFDVNHDGEVGPVDLAIVDSGGDADADNDVDLEDAGVFQRCISRSIVTAQECSKMDFDGDGVVRLNDLRYFLESLTGPHD